MHILHKSIFFSSGKNYKKSKAGHNLKKYIKYQLVKI